MKEKDITSKIRSILSTEQKVLDLWNEPPTAALIPFGGNRDSFYLLVSLRLKNSITDLAGLGYVCRKSLHLIAYSGLLKGLRGVEIVPYVLASNDYIRVLRLSVLTEAMDDALFLTETELLKQQSEAGIECGWYSERKGPSARGKGWERERRR